jgi:hypothetical protein
MLDAIMSWGLEPWDLALTFGARSGASSTGEKPCPNYSD